jgi:two-component system, response regulator PdtaR
MVILIVEDEALIGMALRMLLRIEGYRVRGPVRTADEALRIAASEPPDLAFVDVNLGGGSEGIPLARTLRARFATICIFVTALPDQARSARDTALGVIAKPYGPSSVLRAVEAAVAVRSGARLRSAAPGLELFR